MKPTCWTWAIRSFVGPNVDCSRNLIVSAGEGCASTRRTVLTINIKDKMNDKENTMRHDERFVFITTSRDTIAGEIKLGV